MLKYSEGMVFSVHNIKLKQCFWTIDYQLVQYLDILRVHLQQLSLSWILNDITIQYKLSHRLSETVDDVKSSEHFINKKVRLLFLYFNGNFANILHDHRTVVKGLKYNNANFQNCFFSKS